MTSHNIFFDHNSTVPLLNSVREAMFEISSQPLNSSSLHHYGRIAKKTLETARAKLLNFTGSHNGYNTIFTSCGTESNNLALKGFSNVSIITSTIEHPSVIHVANNPLINVTKAGVIDLNTLDYICSIQNAPFLVSIMAANNETGVLQPIDQAAKIVHKYNGLIHSDASQVFGKIQFNISELDLDMVTISAHKFGGPLGAAALIVKKNLDLKPIMFGGGQEFRYRPGTQNLPAIHGFGIAAEIALNTLDEYAKLSQLRDLMERELKNISPNSIVFGGESVRLPNTLSISMPDVTSETQVIYFDINGYSVSAGSACSSGKMDLPYVLMNMGYSENEARCSLRISLGLNNTLDEIKSFVKVWQDLYNNTYNVK